MIIIAISLYLVLIVLLILTWKAYRNYKHICELYTTMGLMRQNLNVAKTELNNFLRDNFEDYKKFYREIDI